MCLCVVVVVVVLGQGRLALNSQTFQCISFPNAETIAVNYCIQQKVKYCNMLLYVLGKPTLSTLYPHTQFLSVAHIAFMTQLPNDS